MFLLNLLIWGKNLLPLRRQRHGVFRSFSLCFCIFSFIKSGQNQPKILCLLCLKGNRSFHFFAFLKSFFSAFIFSLLQLYIIDIIINQIQSYNVSNSTLFLTSLTIPFRYHFCCSPFYISSTSIIML